MLNKKNILLDALFKNNFLNKAFLFIAFCFCGSNLMGQNDGVYADNISVSAGVQSLSLLTYKNNYSADKLNLRNSNLNIAYKKNVFKSINITENKFTIVNLQPSLRISQANFGKDNLNRTFINARLGVSVFWGFSEKSTLGFSLNSFANEDEFTLPDATIRFSGLTTYNKKVNRKFSYNLGLIYTYIFGRGIFIPMAGVRYRTSLKSIANVSFPLGISWKKQAKNNSIFYGFSVRPNGGINQYQNKLSFGNENNTLVYRRNAILLGSNLIYQKSNFRLGFEAGINLRQRFSFTNDTSRNRGNAVELVGSNNLVFNLSFVYKLKPKKRSLKANNETKDDTEIFDEVIDLF